ncbi:Uncharacterised protein [Legionella sainthelensi]|nr:Uncharacterised protein [Legionella sainthelensi]
MELDDFNDLINTYAIIREKKNGGFSAAKATDFSSGDNINQSNEHKKSLTELTSELAQFSEQYVFTSQCNYGTSSRIRRKDRPSKESAR